MPRGYCARPLRTLENCGRRSHERKKLAIQTTCCVRLRRRPDDDDDASADVDLGLGPDLARLGRDMTTSHRVCRRTSSYSPGRLCFFSSTPRPSSGTGDGNREFSQTFNHDRQQTRSPADLFTTPVDQLHLPQSVTGGKSQARISQYRRVADLPFW